MFLGLFVVLFLGVITLAIVVGIRQTGKRRQVLAEGTHDGNTAWGTAQGLDTKIAFTTRGSGSNTTSWTEIDVELPAAYPLSLHVRRHAFFDRGPIEKGRRDARRAGVR